MKANANATICLVAARLKHKRYSRPLRNYGWLKIKKVECLIEQLFLHVTLRLNDELLVWLHSLGC